MSSSDSEESAGNQGPGLSPGLKLSWRRNGSLSVACGELPGTGLVDVGVLQQETAILVNASFSNGTFSYCQQHGINHGILVLAYSCSEDIIPWDYQYSPILIIQNI